MNAFLAIQVNYDRRARDYVAVVHEVERISPCDAYMVGNSAQGIAHALAMLDAGNFGPAKDKARAALRAALVERAAAVRAA